MFWIYPTGCKTCDKLFAFMNISMHFAHTRRSFETLWDKSDKIAQKQQKPRIQFNFYAHRVFAYSSICQLFMPLALFFCLRSLVRKLFFLFTIFFSINRYFTLFFSSNKNPLEKKMLVDLHRKCATINYFTWCTQRILLWDELWRRHDYNVAFKSH